MRQFANAEGQRWTVWRVDPGDTFLLERRRGERRSPRPEAGAPAAGDRRVRAERRLGDIRGGWLCFEAAGGAERRRLYPVPEAWESWSDERLGALCGRAVPVASRVVLLPVSP